jgi:hypothetical protein
MGPGVKNRVIVTVDGFRAAGCARRVWERGTGRRACPLCRREVRAIVQVVERDENVVRDPDLTTPHPGPIPSLTILAPLAHLQFHSLQLLSKIDTAGYGGLQGRCRPIRDVQGPDRSACGPSHSPFGKWDVGPSCADPSPSHPSFSAAGSRPGRAGRRLRLVRAPSTPLLP